MISSGLYTALITPFDTVGNLDEEGFRRNIAFQKKERTKGIVALGSTGEAASLSFEEKKKVLSIARAEASDIFLVAGATCGYTHEAVAYLQWLKEMKIDAALIAPPYYTKPTQEGIFCHFEALSRVGLPLIVYNTKGRVSVNIEIEALERISQLDSIIGIKETCEDLMQICQIFSIVKEKKKDFLVFCGEDALTFSMMALGANGAISVTSNLFPFWMNRLIQSSLKGDIKTARECHFHLLDFFQVINFETNPIPIKAAMHLSGLSSGNPRLPLTPLSGKFYPKLEEILKKI